MAWDATAKKVAVKAIGQVESSMNYAAINYNDPITVGLAQWYGTRAAAILSDWAFFDPAGPRLHRLEIDMIPENTRSVRVAQKLGFTDEGVRKRYMYVNGRWQDHRIFSLLSDEFPRVSLKPYK